ncbi:hypothetical protein ABFS82_02G103200 [Erythranthe guttata]
MFYLAARAGTKFMDKYPNKVHYWDRYYVYISSSTPFPFPTRMINETPPFDKPRMDSTLRNFLDLVRPGWFHVEKLTRNSRILTHFGLRWLSSTATPYHNIRMEFNKLFYSEDSSFDIFPEGELNPVVPTHIGDLVQNSSSQPILPDNVDVVAEMDISEKRKKKEVATGSSSRKRVRTSSPSIIDLSSSAGAGVQAQLGLTPVREGFSFAECEDGAEIGKIFREQATPRDRELWGKMSLDHRIDRSNYHLAKLQTLWATCPSQRSDTLREAYNRLKKDRKQLSDEKQLVEKRNERLEEDMSSLRVEVDSLKDKMALMEEEHKHTLSQLSEAMDNSSLRYEEGRRVGRMEFLHTPLGERFRDEFVGAFLARLWKSMLFFRRALPVSKFFWSEGIQIAQTEIDAAGLSLKLDEKEMSKKASQNIPGWGGDPSEPANLAWWVPIFSSVANQLCPRPSDQAGPSTTAAIRRDTEEDALGNAVDAYNAADDEGDATPDDLAEGSPA